ncbi:MAG: hypothetical protein AAGF14_03465, partial [Pseudomonadota bacterium]
ASDFSPVRNLNSNLSHHQNLKPGQPNTASAAPVKAYLRIATGARKPFFHALSFFLHLTAQSLGIKWEI